MKRVLLITVGAGLAVALVACSGGGGDGSKFPTSVPVTPGLDLRGVSTPTAGEATVIATQFSLETFRHNGAPQVYSDVIDFPYDIQFPKGWKVDETGVALTASLPRPDGFPYATVSVDCRVGVDKSEMLAKDRDSATELSLGNLGGAQPTAYTVAGRDAIRVDWTGGGAFPADHISIYVNGKDCAWRLQLNTLGGIRPDNLSALFLRIVDSFNPDQGLP